MVILSSNVSFAENSSSFRCVGKSRVSELKVGFVVKIGMGNPSRTEFDAMIYRYLTADLMDAGAEPFAEFEETLTVERRESKELPGVQNIFYTAPMGDSSFVLQMVSYGTYNTTGVMYSSDTQKVEYDLSCQKAF